MAWMSDERYELMQDTRDKKITARSAKHTRTHCGKGGSVKFPSDYLSKKELRAMSGKCKSYRMNDPISWNEFKTWPDEHKITYIKLLREKYNAPDTAIADMMGISSFSVSNLVNKLGIGLGKNGRASRKWKKDEFYAWVNGVTLETPVNESVTDELVAVNTDADIQAVIEPDIEAAKETAQQEFENNIREASEILKREMFDNPPVIIPDPDYTYKCAVPETGEMTFEGEIDNILRTIGTLLNNSKVHLVVKWDVVEEAAQIDPSTRNDILKERITAAKYAIMNSERREKLGSKG